MFPKTTTSPADFANELIRKCADAVQTGEYLCPDCHEIRYWDFQEKCWACTACRD